MCYEFSNWLEKARAKELLRAREKMESMQRKTASGAPSENRERRQEGATVKDQERILA